MANNTENVTASKPAVGGAIYNAPLSDSLTIPESASAAMSTFYSFKSLGYVSEDGVVNSNSPESEDVKAWGGDTVLNTQTDKADTFKFTLLEVLNEDVLKAIYTDANVTKDTETGEIKVTANSKEGVYSAWVIDMLLRDGKKKRIVIPNAKIAELGDITYKDDEATGYEVTLSAAPDKDGNTHYEYIL